MNLVKGAKGLAKCALQRARLQVDEADEPTRLTRLEVCRACPILTRKDGKMTTLSRCGGCGCFVLCKTAVKSERCPKGRWA